MNDLIKALQIFAKYEDLNHPLQCEHDKLYVAGINPRIVSDEDIQALRDLDFYVDDTMSTFFSYRYGSC